MNKENLNACLAIMQANFIPIEDIEETEKSPYPDPEEILIGKEKIKHKFSKEAIFVLEMFANLPEEFMVVLKPTFNLPKLKQFLKEKRGCGRVKSERIIQEISSFLW